MAVSFLERLYEKTDQTRSSWLAGLENLDPDRYGDLQNAAPSRLREDSFEEQALRRRRREAVVVNEGDHPLTQQDIIQRIPSHHDTTREMEDRRLERALEVITGANPLQNEERMVYLDENGLPAEVVHMHGAAQPGS